MIEQEIKPATTVQATPAEPISSAPVVPPAGAPRVLRALGLVIVGALLAMGARMALPPSQTIFASLQGETKGVPDIQPPGPAVTFRIITNADRPYPAVPLSAVVRDGDKASVWVAQPEQQFVRREVKLGLEQNGHVHILSGVQPGEQVAAKGGLLLGSMAGS